MTDRTVYNILPEVFPLGEDDVLGVVAENIQLAFDEVSDDAAEAKTANWLATAEDQDLTEYGKKDKTIGKRRGRGEEEYRRFLRALPTAYEGKGRAQDIRAAIGAGILVAPTPHPTSPSYDPDEHGQGGTIELKGYPETLEYDVRLREHAWASHPGGLVRQLAEYADASVVELRDLEYFGTKETVECGDGGRFVERSSARGVVEVGAGERIVEYDQTDRFTGEEHLEGTGDLSGDPAGD